MMMIKVRETYRKGNEVGHSTSNIDKSYDDENQTIDGSDQVAIILVANTTMHFGLFCVDSSHYLMYHIEWALAHFKNVM